MDNSQGFAPLGLNELFDNIDEIGKGSLKLDSKVYMDESFWERGHLRLSDTVKPGQAGRGDFTITKLSDSNIESFATLIPPDNRERIRLPFVYGIGIMAKEKGKDYSPVGALMFSVNYQFRAYVTIEWLFIKEEIRREGYASALLTTFSDQALALRAKSVSCDMPATKESREMADFLAAHGFSLTTQISYVAELTLSQLKQHKVFTDDIKETKVTFLKDISDADIKRGLQVTFGRMNDDARLILDTDISWYDKEVSVAVKRGIRPIAFLLIHRCPDGKLQVIFMRGTKDAGAKEFISMVRASAAAVERIYGPDVRGEIIFRSESGLKLIDKMYYGHQVKLVIRAGISL